MCVELTTKTRWKF